MNLSNNNAVWVECVGSVPSQTPHAHLQSPEQSEDRGILSQVWDFVLVKNDTRLISGSSDAELRVWALNFKDMEKKEENEMEIKEEEGTEGPPSKVFRFDTEGDVKAGQQTDDGEIKDDAVSSANTSKCYELVHLCCFSSLVFN